MTDTKWLAIQSAITWHGIENPRMEGQRTVPYSIHPVRVAARVEAWVHENWSNPLEADDMVIASILHDILEDTDIPADVIEDNWGYRVAYLVFWLTDNEFKTSSRPIRRELQLEKYRYAPIDALLVKTADVIDNMVTLEPKQKGFYANVRRDEICAFFDIVKRRLEFRKDIINDFREAIWTTDIRYELMTLEERDAARLAVAAEEVPHEEVVPVTEVNGIAGC